MQTLGEVLKAERERRGVSLKDVEMATHIRTLYIKALEDNDFNVIPGEVYLKGFIRNYSVYLGLNEEEMVDIYRRQKGINIDDNQHNTKELPKTDWAKVGQKSGRFSGIGILYTSKFMRVLSILGVVSIIGGGLWLFSPSKSSVHTKQQSAPATQPIVVKEEVQLPKTAVTLVAKASDECWTQVVADGKEIYEGTLKKGDLKTWEAKNDLVIRIGDAGSLELTHNGKKLGFAGEKGEVLLRTFKINMDN